MALPKPPFALCHLMAAIAALAVLFALIRVNLAFSIVPACILSMTLARTFCIVQCSRASGMPGSATRWLRAGLGSLGVSAAIIGSGDMAFLLVYALVHDLGAVRMSDGPEPELSWNAVFLAIPSGLAAGYLMRCYLWDRRAVQVDSPDEAMPRTPPVGRPLSSSVGQITTHETS